jgi:MFS family permease
MTKDATSSRTDMKYLLTICFVSTIGGFLFGYDTGVISGGIDFIEKQFQLSDAMKGWVTGSVLLGCFIGSAISGKLANRLGRKPLLVLCAGLLLLSAIGSMLPQTATMLVIARLIGGIGVGITAMGSPTYMSEVSPANTAGAWWLCISWRSRLA